MSEVVRGVLAVCERNARVLRRSIWTSLLGHAAEPFFYLAVFGYGLGHFIDVVEGRPYLVWLMPGIAVASSAMSASLECTYSAFTRMERQKTYLAIASTPVSIEEVVLGEILWAAVMGTMTAVLALLAGACFGAVYGPGRFVWIIACAFGAGLLSAAFALFFTSRARAYEDFAIYFTALLTPNLIVSGAYFPISIFPEALERVASVLPLTQATLAARGEALEAAARAGMLLLYLAPVVWAAVRGISRRVIP